MANMKKPAPRKQTVSRTPSTGVKKPMPKVEGAKPNARKLMSNTTSKASGYKSYVSENVTVISPKTQSSAKTVDDARRNLQIMQQNRKASTPASKAEAKANARGLKAANAKVSKNNAGQNGSKLKSDILKNSTPARPNRIRGGSMRGGLGSFGSGGGLRGSVNK